MMLRAFVLFSAALMFGCSSDEHHMHARGDQAAPACGYQSSCGTCTPVLGCGWCQYEDGSGECTTGPSACTRLKFRWNWEPTDCPVPTTDAGVTPADATPEDTAPAVDDTGTIDTGAADTGTPPTDAPAACNIPPAASAACSVTTGGTLCPANRYTLGCHSTTPDTSLGCAKAYGSGTESYWCCPCGG